ncbi:MAG: hypothetical protein E7305_09385 [Butyrivibrio sp.]|nr:hypothetical protein [Butyrivibrio sp.]
MIIANSAKAIRLISVNTKGIKLNKKNTNLAEFFPMIRSREQVIKSIKSKPKLLAVYNSWRKEQQEEFLSLCTGAKGAKMLYDSYFKEILNPELEPERLSKLLSLLMKRNVTVKEVLANDNSRLGDEMSLVITDIVVELEDGTIANVEVQRLGYAFTGERASCYSADLLLRQYKRVRDRMKKNFSYKDIAPVYTIVFMEKSPSSFKHFSNCYVHQLQTISDTGIKLNMLQNYIFIPVDIFLEKLHNEGINNELEAWLTFLGCDEPEYISLLIDQYPYFKPLYSDLYDICKNTEKVIEMFSKELQILDRNTVKYMIDELQEQLDDTKVQLDDAKVQLDDTKEQLDDAKKELISKDKYIAELEAKLKANN